MAAGRSDPLRRWVGGVVSSLGGDAQLLRGGGGSGLVQAGAMVVSLGLGVVLARGLGPDGYGAYAYAIAILNLLLVAGEIGVPTLLMREVAVGHAARRWPDVLADLRTGITAVFCVAGGLALAGLGIVLVLDPALASVPARTTAIMLAVLPVVAVGKTLAYGLRGLGRVVRAQACEVLFRPVVVLVTLMVLFGLAPGSRQPEVAMTVQLMAAGVVVVLSFWWLKQSLPEARTVLTADRRMGGWLKRAAPFALIGGEGVLNSQTDIIMLGWFRPDAEVGAYRIAQQGGLLTLFVLQAAHSVLGPAFGRMHAQAETEALRANFRWASRAVFAATLPVAGVLIVFATPIVEIVFGPAYALAAGPLAILAAGYLANVAFGPVGLLLQMAGRERVTAQVLWGTVALNALLNALLIPLYGVQGGALATAVAVIVYHALLRAIAYRDLAV